MSRSNTANIDPRAINFEDVKKRLENKIDKINSYQSKRGTFREAPGGQNSPLFSAPQEQAKSNFSTEQNRFPSQPEQTSRQSFGGGHQSQPQNSFAGNSPNNLGQSSFKENNPSSSQTPFSNNREPMAGSSYGQDARQSFGGGHQSQPQNSFAGNSPNNLGQSGFKGNNPSSSQTPFSNNREPMAGSSYGQDARQSFGGGHQSQPQNSFAGNSPNNLGQSGFKGNNPSSSQTPFSNNREPMAGSSYGQDARQSFGGGHQSQPQNSFAERILNPYGQQGLEDNDIDPQEGSHYSSQNQQSPIYNNISYPQDDRYNAGQLQDKLYNENSSNPINDGRNYKLNNFNIPAQNELSSSSDNYYDVHRKLELLEQERLNDLRARIGDSKLSDLARNVEKVEGKIENLQSTSAQSGLVTPMDISLELIQRKLDKLEQDRIDSLRAKIDLERTREIEKSLGKLEAKIDSKEQIIPQQNQSTELLELIQRKLDKLEEDRIDSLKAKIESDRSTEIVKNLEKIESKISATADKSPIAQTAYLDVLSQEDLLRKLERLEQDRVDDLKSIMEQEKILMLNQKIEKLESKIDQNLSTPPVVTVDSTVEIAKKLERLEQNKLEELKAQREEEKLLALSKSLSSIESKLENSQQPSNQNSSLIEKLLSDVVNRLDKLETNQRWTANPTPENSVLEKTIEKLESKIERVLSPSDVLSQKDNKYISTLDAIERKLERLEKDRVDEFKEKAEESRLSSLERSLERIEDSISSHQRYPYVAGSERDGFGKKLDRLEEKFEEDFYSSQKSAKTDKIQESLSKIESKLDSIKDASIINPKNAQDNLSQSFLVLSKRLDSIEKRRQEDNELRLKNSENYKLTKILESIDSKLNTSIANLHSSNKSEKTDFIIENIQKKLDKLEDAKLNDFILKSENERFRVISNHLEKLDSKISNGFQQGTAILAEKTVEDLQKKISTLENSKVEDLARKLEEEKYNKLTTHLEKLDSKLSNLESSKVEDLARKLEEEKYNKLTTHLEKLDSKLSNLEHSKVEDLTRKLEEEKYNKLTNHLEKLDSKISNDLQNNAVNSSEKVVEDLQKKISNLEHSKVEELARKLEEEKYNKLTNHLEKLDSKISNDLQKNAVNSSEKVVEDLQKKISNLENSKAEELARKLEEEKYNKLTNHLEKLDSKISNDLQKNAVNSSEKVVEDLQKKISNLENSKAEELARKLEEEKYNKLTTHLEKLDSKISNDLQNNAVNSSEKVVEDLQKKISNLENSKAEELARKLEEEKYNKLTNHLEKLDSKISNDLQKNAVNSSEKVVEDLQKKISNLENSKAEELARKLEEEKYNKLTTHLEKLDSKIANNVHQVDNNTTSQMMERLSELSARLDQKDALKKEEITSSMLSEIKSSLENVISKNNNTPSSETTIVSKGIEDLQKKISNLENSKAEELARKLEEEKYNKLTNHLEKLDSKISNDLQKNAVNSSEKVVEDLQKKISNLENSKAEELARKLEEEKYNKLTTHLEKLDSKIANNVHQVDNNTTSQMMERLSELSARLDQKDALKKEEITSSMLSEIKSSLENVISKNNNTPSSETTIVSKGIEDLQKKISNLENSKAEELARKLEEEKYNKLTNHLEKLDSKIANNVHQVDNNTTSQMMERLSELDSKFSNRLTEVKEDVVINKLAEKVSDLSSKLASDNNFQNQQVLPVKKEIIYKNTTSTDSVDKLAERISELNSKMDKKIPSVEAIQKTKPQEVSSSFGTSQGKEQKEDENKVILDSINSLKKSIEENSKNSEITSRLDEKIQGIQDKISKLEKPKDKDIVVKYKDKEENQEVIDKNNEILENISDYLQSLTEEFKNLYAKEFTKSSDLSNHNVMNFLENLQSKYLNSLQKIEGSLKETYKNDRELKNMLLEQDLASTEISKLQSDLISKKSSEQTSFLVNEINKIKTHIDDKQSVSHGFPSEITSILKDIKDQQEVIKKSIESLSVVEKPKTLNITQISADEEAPLIEDIKNLLSEVNYRNQVLNETVDDSQSGLSNVINKVDFLSSSLSNIENLVNQISYNNDFGEKYKESLEQNFAKLKEDNYKIIKVLNNNSMQSSLLSDKASLLIKSLKDDIVNLSSVEKQSILKEFSNVKSLVLEFKNLAENQSTEEGKVLSSLNKVLSNLDSISILQEETLNYFKSLDAGIEKSLIDIQKNPEHKNNNLISEVKLYLEDSKNKVKYFNQLKDKIDRNSIVITDFLSDTDEIPSNLVDFTSNFKGSLEGLSNSISHLLETHNKTSENLNSLVEKTDKILISPPQNIGEDLKNKLEDIDKLQKQSLQTSKLIDEKTNDMQSAITNIVTGLDNNNLVEKVIEINTNIDKSKEEISTLIKDSSNLSSNKIEDIKKDLSSVSADINTISSKSDVTSIDIKDLSSNVAEAKKEADISIKKLMDLQEELSSVSSEVYTLSNKTEEIKIDVKENKSALSNVSENIKTLMSSIDSINYEDTLKNVSEKISVLKVKQSNIENLINGFQKEITSKLSPYVSDKSFVENFTKFTNFSSSNIKSIKDSIYSINTNLNTYLLENKVMTNENLVNLLSTFEELINTQDNFFKIYTLNSDRLMGFAKKAETIIPEVNIQKAEKIHSNIKQSIIDVSLKNKKEDIKNIVASNNAKNSKKVDLLANMDYLNKEITKKTKK